METLIQVKDNRDTKKFSYPDSGNPRDYPVIE